MCKILRALRRRAGNLREVHRALLRLGALRNFLKAAGLGETALAFGVSKRGAFLRIARLGNVRKIHVSRLIAGACGGFGEVIGAALRRSPDIIL